MGSQNYLGVIPVGTGNDFYKSISKQNTKLYEKVDVAQINDKYFINIACFGIDADVGNNTKIIKNKLIPIKQRYNASLIYTFFKYKNKEAEFISKEEEQQGKFTTIVIANGMYYGGGFQIAPNSKYNDGLLDVYYAKDLKKYELLGLVLKIKKGTLIASILRDGKMIFPGGNDAIKINDSVMVVTTASSIEDFDDILE